MVSEIDIVNEIQQCWKKRLTGALFLKLENERLLQIFFVDGDVQSIKYRNLSGMDAVKKIPELVASKRQFHQGAVSRVVNELPSTEDVIDMIDNASFDEVRTTTTFNIKDAQAIGKLFTEYVGPIADLIFAEEVQKATSVKGLIQSLYSQMDDLEDRRNFSLEAEKILRKIKK